MVRKWLYPLYVVSPYGTTWPFLLADFSE